MPRGCGRWIRYTHPPKTNIDTKHDGLENVSPFKYGYFQHKSLISWEYVDVKVSHLTCYPNNKTGASCWASIIYAVRF